MHSFLHSLFEQLLILSSANVAVNRITRSCLLPFLYPFQFALGNLDSKRDWGHAKDFVEVSSSLYLQQSMDQIYGSSCVARQCG